MKADEKDSSSLWSREQDKAFENALATYPDDSIDRWEKIAADVPGKTLEEVKHHYDLLVEDINQIESGCIGLPSYTSSLDGSTIHAAEDGTAKKGGHFGHFNSEANHGGKASRSDQERRKGIAWTEDEHKLFLIGLEKYGKGDWRSISRNFVVTRTPTQVASHAQKYFIRLNSMNKDRRRSSIHDITSVNGGDVSASTSTQGPITGQNNNNVLLLPGVAPPPPPTPGNGKASKLQPLQPPAATVYGTPTIGQPIRGPLVVSGSAVGTPVNLPPPHMAYGMRAPVVVPGAPMTMAAPMVYPMPHAAAHR
ncbi:hypothetical protein Dimus_010072 [Dionaea muscipula]